MDAPQSPPGQSQRRIGKAALLCLAIVLASLLAGISLFINGNESHSVDHSNVTRIRASLDEGAYKGWVTVASVGGRYVADDESMWSTCATKDDCTQKYSRVVSYEGVDNRPIRIVCTGDLAYMVIFEISGNPSYASEWNCSVSPAERSAVAGIRVRLPTQPVSYSVDEMYVCPPGSAAEEGSGRFGFEVQVWNGPWQEPLCEFEKSGTPDGPWETCRGKKFKDKRFSNENPPSAEPPKHILESYEELFSEPDCGPR